MIRNEIYTLYCDKEFLISKMEDGHYKLRSSEVEDIKKYGFSLFVLPEYFIASDGKKYRYANHDQFMGYFKIIEKFEVGEVYSIHTFGIYKGLKFPIDMERDDQYMLSTNKAEIAEKLDFYNINKSEFEKWVDKKDIEHIYEIKELIPDFFD